MIFNRRSLLGSSYLARRDTWKRALATSRGHYRRIEAAALSQGYGVFDFSFAVDPGPSSYPVMASDWSNGANSDHAQQLREDYNLIETYSLYPTDRAYLNPLYPHGYYPNKEQALNGSIYHPRSPPVSQSRVTASPSSSFSSAPSENLHTLHIPNNQAFPRVYATSGSPGRIQQMNSLTLSDLRRLPHISFVAVPNGINLLRRPDGHFYSGNCIQTLPNPQIFTSSASVSVSTGPSSSLHSQASMSNDNMSQGLYATGSALHQQDLQDGIFRYAEPLTSAVQWAQENSGSNPNVLSDHPGSLTWNSVHSQGLLNSTSYPTYSLQQSKFPNQGLFPLMSDTNSTAISPQSFGAIQSLFNPKGYAPNTASWQENGRFGSSLDYLPMQEPTTQYNSPAIGTSQGMPTSSGLNAEDSSEYQVSLNFISIQNIPAQNQDVGSSSAQVVINSPASACSSSSQAHVHDHSFQSPIPEMSNLHTKTFSPNTLAEPNSGSVSGQGPLEVTFDVGNGLTVDKHPYVVDQPQARSRATRRRDPGSQYPRKSSRTRESFPPEAQLFHNVCKAGPRLSEDVCRTMVKDVDGRKMCKLCDKFLPRRYDRIAAHLSVHLGHAPHQCKICHKYYSRLEDHGRQDHDFTDEHSGVVRTARKPRLR